MQDELAQAQSASSPTGGLIGRPLPGSMPATSPSTPDGGPTLDQFGRDLYEHSCFNVANYISNPACSPPREQALGCPLGPAIAVCGIVSSNPLEDLLNKLRATFDNPEGDLSIGSAYRSSLKNEAESVTAERSAAPIRSNNDLSALLQDAADQYRGKAGKLEKHHPWPLYLGGDPNQALVTIDAAYHQVITNAFRRLAPYGRPRLSVERAREVMQQVYSVFPLP